MTNTLIGHTINGRYRLESLLGDGGMGTVYRAYDVNLDRQVALKLMHAHFARQEEFRARLIQEARTAAQLDHPSVVQIWDFGESPEGLFIAMEFVNGGSLRDHLRRLQRMRKFLPWPKVCKLGPKSPKPWITPTSAVSSTGTLNRATSCSSGSTAPTSQTSSLSAPSSPILGW